MIPGDFEVDKPELKELIDKLGKLLRGVVPEGYGFSLLIFGFGNNSDLFYTSNAQRYDMIKTMQEFIDKHKKMDMDTGASKTRSEPHTVSAPSNEPWCRNCNRPKSLHPEAFGGLLCPGNLCPGNMTYFEEIKSNE